MDGPTKIRGSKDCGSTGVDGHSLQTRWRGFLCLTAQNKIPDLSTNNNYGDDCADLCIFLLVDDSAHWFASTIWLTTLTLAEWVVNWFFVIHTLGFIRFDYTLTILILSLLCSNKSMSLPGSNSGNIHCSLILSKSKRSDRDPFPIFYNPCGIPWENCTFDLSDRADSWGTP